MRLAARALLAGALAGGAEAQAQSVPQGADDAWYVSARGGIVMTDQNYDNDGTLVGIALGRFFGPEYAFELEVTGDELDFGIDYGLRQRSVELNMLKINPVPLWHPYFLMGIGYIEFDGPDGLAIETGHNAMFNLGVGGMWELVPPSRVMLRGDLRLRYDLNDTHQPGQSGFGDGVFSLGLLVPF